MITDQDINSLIVHYATIVQHPASTQSDVDAIFDVWTKYPDIKQRVTSTVFEETIKALKTNGYKPFWLRPAQVNIEYGGNKQ